MAQHQQQIALKISDRTFVTSKSTLINGTGCGSQYFAEFFKTAQPDLSSLSLDPPAAHHHHHTGDEKKQHTVMPTYHLDLDPRIFHHVLDYLRSGMMPFLWHEDRGFDLIAYAKLERMASMLQIPRLLDWVRRKAYLQVVQQTYGAEIMSLGRNLGQKPTAQFASAAEKLQYHVIRSGDWGAGIVLVRKWTNIDNRVLFDGL